MLVISVISGNSLVVGNKDQQNIVWSGVFSKPCYKQVILRFMQLLCHVLNENVIIFSDFDGCKTLN